VSAWNGDSRTDALTAAPSEISAELFSQRMCGAGSEVRPGEPTEENAAPAVDAFISGNVMGFTAHPEDDTRSTPVVESRILRQRIST
jgi:hypothetical protein